MTATPATFSPQDTSLAAHQARMRKRFPPVIVRTEPYVEPPPPLEYRYPGELAFPLPVVGTQDALEALARHRGALAIAGELEAAIALLRTVVLDRHKLLDSVDAIREHVPFILDATTRRATYIARHELLVRGKFRVKEADFPALPVLSHLARLTSQHGVVAHELRVLVAAKAKALEAELAAADRGLAELGTIAAGNFAWSGSLAWPPPSLTAELLPFLGGGDNQTNRLKLTGAWPTDVRIIAQAIDRIAFHDGRFIARVSHHREWAQDGWIRAWMLRTAERKVVACRLASLEADRGKTTEVVSQRCQQAIEAAGGVDAITGSIVGAEAISGDFPLVLRPWLNTVATLEGELAAITTDWDKLALALGSCLNQPAADNLRARQAAAAARLEAARVELRQHHQRLAGELVTAACEGAENARARIEALTIACPQAFPDGFAAAIAAARFDQAVLAELAAALNS